MENLKLRAWYKKGYGERMKDNLTPNTFCNQFPSNAENCMDIMLSTGVSDKNGIEIYAGDYVQDILTKCRYEVKFGYCRSRAYIGFYLFSELDTETSIVADDGSWMNSYLEVIGNKHKNPGLLTD